MTCPICGGKTRVVGVRSDCDAIYRRRKCSECDRTIYTVENETDYTVMRELDREARIKSNEKKKRRCNRESL